MFEEIHSEVREEIRREFKEYFLNNSEGIQSFEEADVILTAHQLKALEQIKNEKKIASENKVKEKSKNNVEKNAKTDTIAEKIGGNNAYLFEEMEKNPVDATPPRIRDEDDDFSHCGSLDFTPINGKTGVEQLDDPNLRQSIESEAYRLMENEFDFRNGNFLGGEMESVAAEKDNPVTAKQTESEDDENEMTETNKMIMREKTQDGTNTNTNIVEEDSPKLVSSKPKKQKDDDSLDSSKKNDNNSSSDNDKSDGNNSDTTKSDSNSSYDSSNVTKTRISNKKKYMCSDGCKQIVSTDIPSYCDKPHRLWNTVCHGCGVDINRSVMKATGAIFHCTKTGVYKSGVLLCSFVMCGKCHLEREESNGKTRRRTRGN